MDTAASGLSELVKAFDDPAAIGMLRATLRVVFETQTEEELELVVYLCRMIYIAGAFNCCKVATGEKADVLSEELREQWERIWWIHQPGGTA